MESARAAGLTAVSLRRGVVCSGKKERQEKGSSNEDPRKIILDDAADKRGETDSEDTQ